ncbi:DNA alkylation repair protein [Alkalibacterium sp. 20]|uniref:DNA alkylation repair protein n=1 Tax=Alkalibacterium sp. 20 TaxID=1798803 RepID=UPI00090015C1|nr:DNA alkylation repair protein [Alkalibacterium sp. 20]OJF97067.1 DNA alkylation repair protein [Alkalibacterium sp. 20]
MKGKILLEDLKKNKDADHAVHMKRYMRDQFDFLGIPATKRRELVRPYFKVAKKEAFVDWDFLNTYWELPFRECQYIASDYLLLKQNQLVPSDVGKIKILALTKPWWDTIDSLDKVIGGLATKYPELNQMLLEWSVDESIWLRRIAINHQRHRKDRMDTALLEEIIKNNLGSSEFFINKAIGWILRDYSKTNPEWVSIFIDHYKDQLHPLSIREGSKYLN